MLALGRALGETMAVTFVIGNATKIHPHSCPGHDHLGDDRKSVRRRRSGLFTSRCWRLASYCSSSTFLVLAAARWMLSRMQLKA